MILADDLRKAVLQAAIQGKLVEQRSEEGTGEELYAQIRAKKTELIKQGVTNKEQTLSEIAEEEIPFDIPESWKWVRLDEIVTIKGGKRLPKGKSLIKERTDHIYIRVTDMKNNTVDDTDLHYLDDETYAAISQYIITDADLYIVIVGSTIGKVGSIPHLFNNMNLTENAARIMPHIVNKDYLLQVLKSDFAQKQFADKTKQVGQPKLALIRLKSALIPLPPLEEQKRICEKLGKALSEINAYADAEQELTSLQSAFPNDMRKSILQYAMQGKLAEQRPEEGTGEELYQQIQAEKEKLVKEGKIKKEKPLPEITDEDTPFDIPESWKWVKFGDVVDFRLGKTPPRTDAKSWGNDYKWISISDMVSDGHVSETKEGISQFGFESVFGATISPKGTLIMSFKLTIGCVSILDIDALHNEAIISIFPIIDENTVMRDYMFKIMPYVSKTGDSKKAIKGNTLNSKSLRNLLLPLPPLEEQQRIVEKLDKILPLTDSIKEAI